MEIGLGDNAFITESARIFGVLILVLVEIGLGATGAVTAIKKSAIRLNPCFSGNRFGSYWCSDCN